MTTLLPGTTPEDALSRDRFGRPLIVPVDGGKPRPYTRVSTLAKTLDDTFALTKWVARMTAKGIAGRDDLRHLVASTDDKRSLDDACKAAQEFAGAGAKANLGTALHSFAEAVDTGKPMDAVPGEYRAHIQAYLDATKAAGLKSIACEQFVVNDDLEAAGTFDRLYLRSPEGKLRVGDLKTGGNPKFYALATAIQVATYARGSFYDVASGERKPLPVDRSIGYLVHVPQDRPEATVYELDLEAGWLYANLAYDVRQARNAKVLGPA